MIETDPSVAASDMVSANSAVAIAFRQSRTGNTGMGTLVAHGVRVATTFVEAVPEPTGLLPLSLLGLLAVKMFRRRD